MLQQSASSAVVDGPIIAGHRAPRFPITQLRLSPRETLPLGEDEGESLYRLTDGCIALAQYLPDGRRQVCDILGPGRLFGFALQGRGQCTAEALSYCSIERFGQGQMPADLPRELARLLTRQQNHALLLGRKTAAERVATAVIDLAQQFARRHRPGGRAYAVFPVVPTRADLADWLGLTFETVSRCLNQFKRDRLIRLPRPELVTIIDIAGLCQLAGLTEPPAVAPAIRLHG